MKKRISCPICGFARLIDSDENVKSELREESEITDGWHPDYFMKCPHCKKQIGIKKII